MKISCLCITTSKRKTFKNWLLWNYLKQSHYNKNLIVVSDDDDWPEWVEWIYADVNEPIPVKRNMALACADGEAITWFDDDDWQHTNKLKIINDNTELMTMVGCSNSFFLDPLSLQTTSVDTGTIPIFNSLGVMRYGLPAFAESMIKYSDTDWINKLLTYRGAVISETMLFFWLTHRWNTSNPIDRIRPNEKLNYYLDGESWQQLRKLEANLKIASINSK